MHLRCPHCQNPIELADLPSGGEITCAGCGSSFHLDKFSTATFTAPANKRLDKFEIFDTVGHGAFGTVLKARDTELDRIVAIKVPRAGNVGPGPEDVDRFLRERIWSATDGALTRTLDVHAGPVREIVFSKEADFAATVEWDRVKKGWNYRWWDSRRWIQIGPSYSPDRPLTTPRFIGGGIAVFEELSNDRRQERLGRRSRLHGSRRKDL